MTITLHIDPSWAAVPVALSRVHLALTALEHPRQPGDDGDDLAELLDVINDPEPSPAPPTPKPPAARPAAKPFDGAPTTGRGLYCWACDHKALPDVNRIGKSFGYPKQVSDWEPSQVAAAYRILTEPAANGRPR
jgi:hypothetical protein